MNISDEQYISLICNGEFNAIPGFAIGELFENFFDNINYNVVKEDVVYVDFTGDVTCDDEPCTILIRFEINADATEFEVKEVKVDEDVLTEPEVLDLLEDIAYIGGAVIEGGCCGCEDGDCSCCGGANEEDDDDEENSDEDKE